MYELYLELLRPLIRWRTISTDLKYADTTREAARYLVDIFEKYGFQVQILEGAANPIIVAKYAVEGVNTTTLIYGHYDVQPASMEEGWTSDPFELTERDGRLYARGISDNKGQFMIHMAAVLDLIRRSELGKNITFLIEGNEESGSNDLGKVVMANRELLKADCVVVSDGEIKGEQPVLTTGFRGVGNVALTVTTSDHDFHSGLYGGKVPNALHEMGRILASLHDAEGKVQVPGFSDETAIEVTGICGGYIGEGYRNSIPGCCTARINIRTEPEQDVEEAAKALEKYCCEQAGQFGCEMRLDEFSVGCFIDTNSRCHAESIAIAEHVYGHPIVMEVCGGSLPIANDFEAALGVPQVFASLANEDCGMHDRDENMRIDILKKGLLYSEAMFRKS